MRARILRLGNSRVRSNKGIVLITVIIIFSFLGIIGLSLIILTYSTLITVESEIQRFKAFYLAESGIAVALNALKRGTEISGDIYYEIGPEELGSGSYKAIIDSATGTITGIGEIDDIQRTIEVKYKIL